MPGRYLKSQVAIDYFPGILLSGIKARACNDHFAGTADNVRVHLRRNVTGHNESCSTNWLHEDSDYWVTHRWSRHSTETWTTKEELGTCNSTSFQSISNLEFRLELNPQVIVYNNLKLCQLEADFGQAEAGWNVSEERGCLLYTSPSPRD